MIPDDASGPNAATVPETAAVPDLPATVPLSAGIMAPIWLLAAQLGLGILFGLAYGAVAADTDPMNPALPTLLAGSGSALFMIWWARHQVQEYRVPDVSAFGWRPSIFDLGKTVWTVVLLFVAIRFTVGLYYALFLKAGAIQDGTAEQVLGTTLQAGSPLQTGLSLLFMVLIGPLSEELVFRGYLQSALTSRLGHVAGIAIASAAFASFHFSLILWPLYFVMGVGFGLALHVTRSLWAAIALHMMNNLLAFIAMWAGWI